MKKSMKQAMGIAVLMCGASAMYAQDVETSVGVDLVSGYIWRGQELGQAGIQPGIAIEWKGWSLSGWGSVGLNGTDTKEFDLNLGYKTGGFSVSVTDYWFTAPQGSRDYFHYKAGQTAHVMEAQIGYDFGVAALNWYTNFAGNDGYNQQGERAYSSYLSATVPFQLGGLNWAAGIGGTPWATTFYATDGIAVTEVSIGASKDIKVKDDYSLPLYARAIWNPSTEGAWLVAGVHF